MKIFPVFKKISFGGITRAALFSQLEKAEIQFNSYAQSLFINSAFSVSEIAEPAQLVKVNLLDLQFTEPSIFSTIVQRAAQHELQCCPLALAAFLRLEYLDQPEGPMLTVASFQPEDSEDSPNGFYLRNFHNSLWLRGYRASADYLWPLESEFIFGAI